MTAETEETLRRILRREADRAQVSAPPLEAILAGEHTDRPVGQPRVTAAGTASTGRASVGATPPVETARTTRRHRRRKVGVAVAAVVALAVGGVTTAILARGSRHPQRVTVGPTSPARTQGRHRQVAAPELAPAVRGARPTDIGLLRLWLPDGWKLEPQDGFLLRGCVPAPADSVVLASTAHPACKGSPLGPSVIVSPLGRFAPGPGLVRRMINGVAVWTSPSSPDSGDGGSLYEVPSLRVRLVTRGHAVALVESLGPSALRVVLTAHYPVSVPSGWKRVTYDGFAADVPPSWPTRRALVARIPGGGISITGLPADCGYGIWKKPSTFVGDQIGAGCPPFPLGSYRVASGYPADGLWLQSIVGADNVQFGLHPPHATVPGGTVEFPPLADLGGDTDVLDVDLTAGNEKIETVIGLGPNPLTAEEIISSLHRV